METATKGEGRNDGKGGKGRDGKRKGKREVGSGKEDAIPSF